MTNYGKIVFNLSIPDIIDFPSFIIKKRG